MAKDGTNRGGPRPGTGPKRKPLVDKIQDGTAKGTLVMQDDLPEPAEIQGEDVPPSGITSRQSRKTAATYVPRRFSERRGCGSSGEAVKC